MSDLLPDNYLGLLLEIKARIRKAQYEALKAVNKELIALYWDIGRMIVERQQGASWGKSVVENLAKGLQAEVPGIKGFSAPQMPGSRRAEGRKIRTGICRQDAVLSGRAR